MDQLAMDPPSSSSSSDETAASKTFYSQTTLIMEVAVESAIAVIQQTLGKDSTANSVWQAQFTSIMDMMTREAIRKICRVFRELYFNLVNENKDLRGLVGWLEGELRSKVRTDPLAEKGRTQTIYKIEQSDGPALWTAEPSALAMAILNSAKSTGSAANSPQVPLVIISQPVPSPTSMPQNTTQPSSRSQEPPVEARLAPTGPLTGTSQTTSDHQAALLASEVLPNPYVPLVDISQVFPSLPVTKGQATSNSADPSGGISHVSSPEEEEMKMENTNENPEESLGHKELNDEDSKEQKRERRRALYKQKRFFCELCNRGFHQRYQLKKHMDKPCNKPEEAQETTPDRLLACDQCDEKFKLPRQLILHLMLHKSKKYPKKCQMCPKMFSTVDSLKNHEMSHAYEERERFICDICGKGFTGRKRLHDHQVIHTGTKPFQCPTCGKRFATSNNLRVHERSHSDERPFQCLVCKKAFKCKVGLLQHQVVHTREKPFVCQTCGLSFGLKTNFQRHMRRHSGEKPYRCEVCGKRFSRTCTLKNHMLVHGAEKPFMCDLCGKTFFYNFQLLKHQQLFHENKEGQKVANGVSGQTPTVAKPFSCKICLRGFCSTSSLKTHEKSHADDKEFTCDTCGKSFHLKHLYIYHMRQHSGERPYICTVCEKGFYLKGQLKQHKLIHTGEKPHKCDHCGKEFREPQNYRRHLRIHTGEKPYECNVCTRKFSHSSALKSHMQIHTGVKLYSCKRCEQGFSDSRQLKKHNCADRY